jgi:DNA-binding NarL/FixJ family response regulator
MESARREQILSAYHARIEEFERAARKRERLFGRIAIAEFPDTPRSLSERECEVLALIAEGYTSKDIGERLYVAEETVKSHVTNVLGYLGARNRAHAVAIAFRSGLLASVDSAA